MGISGIVICLNLQIFITNKITFNFKFKKHMLWVNIIILLI